MKFSANSEAVRGMNRHICAPNRGRTMLGVVNKRSCSGQAEKFWILFYGFKSFATNILIHIFYLSFFYIKLLVCTVKSSELLNYY